jgi:hypothetical protein
MKVLAKDKRSSLFCRHVIEEKKSFLLYIDADEVKNFWPKN